MLRLLPHPRPAAALFLLAVLAVSSTSAPAAENAMNVVPDTALAWGSVNHLADADAKIQMLGKIMQVPAGSVVDMLLSEMGIQKGIDRKGSVGFFVVPGKNEKDMLVVFVAVSDSKEFLDNFETVKAGEKINEVKNKKGGEGILVAFRNGYALIGQKGGSAVQQALDAKKSIAAEMAGMESWLAENDASIVGTAAGIKMFAKMAADQLKDAQADSGPEAEILKAFRDTFGKVCADAPKEISLAVAGIRCDKQGAIRIIGRARLAKDGRLAKATAGLPAVDGDLFAGLPGGPFVFAAAGINVPSLAEEYMKLSGSMMKAMKSLYGLSDDEVDRVTSDSTAFFKMVRSMSFVMKAGKRSDPIYGNMFSTLTVDDSAEFMAAYEKYSAKADELMRKASKGLLKSMTAKRIEIAGKPALQQDIQLDLSAIPGAEVKPDLMEKLLGVGGKMVVYIVAADKQNVVMGVGVPAERMVLAIDVLKQPKKALAQDAEVSASATMLPAGSQWVAYLSFRGYMQMTQRMMSMVLKDVEGAEGFTLPSFPNAPPLGLAVKAQPDEVLAEIAIPAGLVQATGEYVKEMQKMVMERMMEQNTPQPPAP